MDISIVMSTRDRGELVLPSVESIRQSVGCQWELVIIDQSASEATAHALEATGVLADRRLTYRRTANVGLSRGRNEGILHTRGAVVAFTDDDCLVSPEWAQELVRRFRATPKLAVMYASVLAAPDAGIGWVPEFRPIQEGLVSISPDIIRSLGIGANFSVRRSYLAMIGPFDPILGAGAPIGAAEDTDFGYRAARLGLSVYTAKEPSVIHYGVRQSHDISALGSRYLQGMAAMCMKHVRCGDIDMLSPVKYELVRWIAQGTGNLLHRHRPSGYRAVLSLFRGMLASFRYDVDRKRRLYRPR